MEKTRVPVPKVTCGSCRQFDGQTWCHRWNFHTTAESPPCKFYKRAVRLESGRDLLDRAV